MSLPNKAQEEVGMDAQGYRPGCQLPPPPLPSSPSPRGPPVVVRHPGGAVTMLQGVGISSFIHPYAQPQKIIVCHKVRIKGPLMHDKVCLPWASWQFLCYYIISRLGTCRTLTLI